MQSLTLFFAFLILGAGAQQAAPTPDCPTIATSCPASVEADNPMTFTANVSGGDPNVTPTYNWTVSAGTIESGQGTSTITVSTTGVSPDSTITATVDVGGYDRECNTSSSCTGMIMPKAEAKKFVEYGTLPLKEEQAKLDDFFIEFYNSSETRVYIYAYGGRASRPGDARKVAERAKKYLIGKRELDAASVTIVDGGYREEPTIELWLVPNIVEAPAPTPTVDRLAPKKAPAKSAPKKSGKKS
jgi:hypothetical protein